MTITGPQHPPDPNEITEARLTLLVAYFQAARDELNSRIGHRDNALLLFLAAATAVFGAAFGQVEKPALLFAIAPLGLGAALVISQHNDVIGGLHDYCVWRSPIKRRRCLEEACQSHQTRRLLFLE
jgi:hypothetical protein